MLLDYSKLNCIFICVLCFADVAFCGHGVRTRQIWGQADGYPLTVINRSWRGRRRPLFAPFTDRSVSEPPFS